MGQNRRVEPGQIIGDKYRLITQLGEGGMGSVWTAMHLELKAPVALKFMGEVYADDPQAIARFLREAKAAALLRSPHVVQIFDYGTHGGLAYIVMERLEGESLREKLKRENQLDAQFTAKVMTHVGRAMSRAHELDIVHRDLKPANIFLVPNDDEVVAKVLDFGIAKFLAGEDSEEYGPSTGSGALLGSPHYMSPERIGGFGRVDHFTDLWAIGVIAFECLCGRRPFSATTIEDLFIKIRSRPLPKPSKYATVPEGFDEWFDKALCRDSAQRYQSAKQLTNALMCVLTQQKPDVPTKRYVDLGEEPPSSDRTSSRTQFVGKPIQRPDDDELGMLTTVEQAVHQAERLPDSEPQKDDTVATVPNGKPKVPEHTLLSPGTPAPTPGGSDPPLSSAEFSSDTAKAGNVVFTPPERDKLDKKTARDKPTIPFGWSLAAVVIVGGLVGIIGARSVGPSATSNLDDNSSSSPISATPTVISSASASVGTRTEPPAGTRSEAGSSGDRRISTVRTATVSSLVSGGRPSATPRLRPTSTASNDHGTTGQTTTSTPRKPPPTATTTKPTGPHADDWYGTKKAPP